MGSYNQVHFIFNSLKNVAHMYAQLHDSNSLNVSYDKIHIKRQRGESYKRGKKS